RSLGARNRHAPTWRAPPASWSRQDAWTSFVVSLPHPLRVTHQRANHTDVRVAAADDAIQGRYDFFLRRIRVPIDVRLSVQQDATEAIPALQRLLLDECGLDRVRPVRRPETLDRGHLMS